MERGRTPRSPTAAAVNTRAHTRRTLTHPHTQEIEQREDVKAAAVRELGLGRARAAAAARGAQGEPLASLADENASAA
jgi:hypothetical protein